MDGNQKDKGIQDVGSNDGSGNVEKNRMRPLEAFRIRERPPGNTSYNQYDKIDSLPRNYQESNYIAPQEIARSNFMDDEQEDYNQYKEMSLEAPANGNMDRSNI